MKRFLCAVICSGICATASAATKCVALDASKAASSYDYEYNQPDWTVTESDGTVIKGIGVCASAGASNYADKADTITIGSSNTYCWCKMLSPAVSSWVFYYDYEDAGGCASSCGYVCAYDARSSSDFRAALFGSIP